MKAAAAIGMAMKKTIVLSTFLGCFFVFFFALVLGIFVGEGADAGVPGVPDTLDIFIYCWRYFIDNYILLKVFN